MSSAVTWRALEGTTAEGKFPLRQWVGESDHSAVFLTERLLRGVTGAQRAAIKLFPAGQTDSAAQLSLWRAAAQLTHPHLIRIFDSGRCQIEDEQFLYVVTEYADEDLSQILPHRPLTPGEAADMLPPLLDALSYLHGKGLIHANIRPSNVLAVGDQLKLSSDQILPTAGATLDRRRRDVFDAPETAVGVFTPESDVWSVGATLVAALAQGSGLSGEASHGDPPLPPAMPEPFRGIARECLRLDPKRRTSIPQIMARLQPAGRSVPADPEDQLTPRRSGRAPITIAILIIAVVVAMIVFFSHGKNAPPQSSDSGPAPSQSSSQSGPSQSSPSQSGSSQSSAPSVAAPNRAAQSTPTAPSVSATPPASVPKTPPATVASAPATPAANQSATQPANQPLATGDDVVQRVIPDVPQSARNTITGKVKVVVRVDVDASGKVSSARLTSPGPSKYFARLALNAAQGWEFSPTQSAGQSVASSWILHFRFGRKGAEVSPERVRR